MTKANFKAVSVELMVLHLLLLMSGFCLADDAKPAQPEKTEEKPASKQADKEKPKEKSYLEKLGEDLFKEVDDSPAGGAKKADGESDKMERAVKGMRNAGNRLDEGLTAEETQTIQKQVIKDLDDIINQLENPPPNQGGGGGGGGGSGGGGGGSGGGGGGGASGRNRRGGGGAQMRLRRPQGAGGRGMAAGQQRPGQALQEEGAGEQTSDKGTDSSKQAQAARKAAEEAERRRKLEMDIWGHLPAHLREELLSTYGERMLPKYEHLVKQFYEALSTQQTSKSK